MIRRLATCTICLAWCATGLANSPAANLVLTGGQSLSADFVGVAANSELRFRIDGNDRDLQLREIIRWGGTSERVSGPVIVTADGSLLVADENFPDFRIENEVLTFATRSFDEVEVPIERLVGIVFQPPRDSLQLDLMIDQLARKKTTTDVVILDNGDQLKGTLSGLSDRQIRLDSSVGAIHLDETIGVSFNSALVVRTRAANERLVFDFRRGSRVVAREWSTGQGGIRLTTVDGLKLNAKVKDIVGIQAFGRHVTYVSDLKAASYRHRPYLNLDWQYQKDRNTVGGRLRCGGQLYEKGLGIHSVAGLTYDLDRPYQEFQADLGIDDATGGKGSVVFRVYVDDGSGKWAQKFQSAIVRGGDMPMPMSVDLTGVKRLTLIVDKADRGDEQDHAVWLNARLLP